MKSETFEQLIRKGLALDTAEIPAFIDQIEAQDVREQVRSLLTDDEALTQFFMPTAAGADALASVNFQDLQPGDAVGHVLIKKMLAKGGMGSVYLGFDQKLKRQVAIKTIRSEYLQHQLTQQRFEQEALLLSQINHPSICQIYERIESERGDALVLEYIDGKTLDQLDLNGEDMLDAFIEIVSALVVAHDHGIIHRDLKPDNIMRNSMGQIKILDFGIAKSNRTKTVHEDLQHVGESNALTQHGSLMGTLTYMSPEQMAGKGLSEASDLYSLGIIMYQLLAGESPYAEKAPDQLQQAVMRAEIRSLENIPKTFRGLIQQLTQKIPVHRPTARHLKQQLLVIKHEPERQKQRNLRLAALAVVVILGLLLLWQQSHFRKDKNKLLFMGDTRAQIENNRESLDKIYTLPKHDISEKLAESELLHEQLVNAIQANTYLSNAEKSVLIGESLYASDQYEAAIDYLQPAWQAGQRTPDLAFKLAHALSMKYRNQSFETSNSRKAQQETDNQVLIDQARVYFDYLQQQSHVVDPMLNAYEAYFEGDYQKALSFIDIERAEQQGLFRDMRLQGMVYRKLYAKAMQDQNLSQAQVHFDRSQAAYLQAINFGRSYPRSYSDLCGLYQQVLGYTIIGKATGIEVPFLEVKATCQSAFEVYPFNSNLISHMVGFMHRYAEWQMLQGADAMPVLQEALAWNQKSYDLYKSQNQANSDTEGDIYLNRAILYDLMASDKLRMGMNPGKEVQQALDAYQTSVDLMPYAITPISSNMYYSLIIQLKHQLATGQPLQPFMDRADTLWNVYQQSEHKNKYDVVHIYRSYGDMHQLMARSAIAKEQPYEHWVTQSSDLYQQALARDDQRVAALAGLAANALLVAEQNHRKSGLTEKHIRDLKRAIETAAQSNRDFYWVTLLQANVFRLLYQHSLTRGEASISYFEQASDGYQKALKQNSNQFQVYFDQALLYLLRSKAELSQVDWIKSREAVEQALNINSKAAQALLLKAELLDWAVKNSWPIESSQYSTEQLRQEAYRINPKVRLSL